MFCKWTKCILLFSFIISHIYWERLLFVLTSFMHGNLLFCDYTITLSPYIQIRYWNISLFMKSIGCKQLFSGSHNAFRCQWGHMIRWPPLTMPTRSLFHPQGTLKILSPYLETVKRYKQLNIISSISKATPKKTWQRGYRWSHLGGSERVKLKLRRPGKRLLEWHFWRLHVM